ncbi:hypothetical protein D3C77_418650 [compost metagenome]
MQPVDGKAPRVVAAQVRVAFERGIVTVQRVGLKDQEQPEDFGVILSGLAQFGSQRLTGGERLFALLRALTQVQHLAPEPRGQLVSTVEAVLYLQCLYLGFVLQGALGGL